MEYLESKDSSVYLPAKRPSSKLFYGNEHFLSAFRMFFTLYERMLRAWETANSFEVNTKTEKLTKEVGYAEIEKEVINIRYRKRRR